MSDLDDIRCALEDGIYAAQSMRDKSHHWSGREAADRYLGSLQRGKEKLEKLSRDLRDGRKYIEPPDDLPPRTQCYCSEPTCSPPCGWCTEPHDD